MRNTVTQILKINLTKWIEKIIWNRNLCVQIAYIITLIKSLNGISGAVWEGHAFRLRYMVSHCHRTTMGELKSSFANCAWQKYHEFNYG